MKLSDIIKRVNKLVSNSSSFQLNYSQLQHYIDTSIDYINLVLKTEMPTPQECWEQSIITNYINDLLTTHGVFTVDDLIVKLNEDPNINISTQQQFDDYINEHVEITTVPITYDYTVMSDNIIRTVLIYHVAASYLEEEDEFESQYKTYMNRADESLIHIQHTYYSMYQTNIFDLDKPKPKGNPYWIGEEDV